jgi:hypothetical protein
MKNTPFLWAILAVSIGLAQDKPSMVGNWKLDIAQSEFGAGPAPKSQAGTIFIDTPQKLSYRVQGIDEKGQAFWYSWSGPEDGSKHTTLINGRPGDLVGFTRDQGGTLVQHSWAENGSTVEGHISLSPDGNTLTIEGPSKSRDGKESRDKQVWHRVGGANGKPAS